MANELFTKKVYEILKSDVKNFKIACANNDVKEVYVVRAFIKHYIKINNKKDEE